MTGIIAHVCLAKKFPLPLIPNGWKLLKRIWIATEGYHAMIWRGGGGGGETVLRNAFQSNHAAVKVVPKIARVFSVELGVIVFFDCEMCWHPFSNLLISPFPGSLCWFTAETFAFLRKQRRLRFARVATLPSPPYNTSFSKWRPQDVHKLYTKDYAIRWWPLGGSIYIQQSHFILTFGGSLLTELYGKKVMKVIKLLIRNPFQFSARWI